MGLIFNGGNNDNKNNYCNFSLTLSKHYAKLHSTGRNFLPQNVKKK